MTNSSSSGGKSTSSSTSSHRDSSSSNHKSERKSEPPQPTSSTESPKVRARILNEIPYLISIKYFSPQIYNFSCNYNSFFLIINPFNNDNYLCYDKNKLLHNPENVTYAILWKLDDQQHRFKLMLIIALSNLMMMIVNLALILTANKYIFLPWQLVTVMQLTYCFSF